MDEMDTDSLVRLKSVGMYALNSEAMPVSER